MTSSDTGVYVVYSLDYFFYTCGKDVTFVLYYAEIPLSLSVKRYFSKAKNRIGTK